MEMQRTSICLNDGSSRTPKHERLKSHLMNEMIAGRLKPGQALPSERQFVHLLGVARMTVCQALGSLESDGLIRRVQGKGTFVEDDVRQKLSRGVDIFALVVPETREGFYPSLLHGFGVAASEVHHQTLICCTHDDVERQASIVLQLIDKKVGGVVFNPTTPQLTPPFQIRQLQERGIPVVFCHHRVEGISAPALAIPFGEIGRRAGRTLVKHGHRHVAFFSTLGPTPSLKALEAGVHESLRSGGSAMTSHFMTERPQTLREESCLKKLTRIFAKPNPPTAIFASFDPLAELIYVLLLRLGIRVPDDVSLLSFGGAWRDAALTRELTSIVIDEDVTGRKAVSLLHEMRCGDRAIDDNSEFIMELGFSEGKTLRALT